MFSSPPQKKFLKAAANGDVAELNRCLNNEIPSQYDINTRDGNGRTALILAAKSGAVDTLKILLAKKADIEMCDGSGRSALWWACYNARPEAAKILIAAGASANAHDNDYCYALHFAARYGDLDVAKALVGAGADVNATTKNYLQTPLHMAVENRRNPVVEYLLAQGARLDAKNSNGYTPYDRAKALCYKQLQEMLATAAAKPQATAPAAAPAPAAAAAPEAAGESWLLLAPDTVAHVSNFPPINRKLTEIFNFGSRERTVVTENLKTQAETMTPPERFEALAEEIVARAEERLKALGGNPPDKNQKRAFSL